MVPRWPTSADVNQTLQKINEFYSLKPKLNEVLLVMQIQSVEVSIRKVSVIIREGTIRETVSQAPATPLSSIPVVPNQSLNPPPQPAQQPLRPLPLPNPSLRDTEPKK